MTRINILPPLVADMIAAGEVVERPASVIKELMENSFDAGANKVTVEFKSGGATYIKISDDGCSMSPEDAGIAFTRIFFILALELTKSAERQYSNREHFAVLQFLFEYRRAHTYGELVDFKPERFARKIMPCLVHGYHKK